MALVITQRQEKWRFKIQDEEWEFDNREDFEKYLKLVLDIKEKHGRVNL